LKEAIVDWNERMGAIIRTPEMHEAADLAATFKTLNEEGRSLANRLNAEMSGEVKVSYLPEPAWMSAIGGKRTLPVQRVMRIGWALNEQSFGSYLLSSR
jgi:hypothetical protein